MYLTSLIYNFIIWC